LAPISENFAVDVVDSHGTKLVNAARLQSANIHVEGSITTNA